jgi:hypothetical protein
MFRPSDKGVLSTRWLLEGERRSPKSPEIQTSTIQQHPRDCSWPLPEMSLYECTWDMRPKLSPENNIVKWRQEARSPKLTKPRFSSTGRARRGVPVRVARRHQRLGEKAHATSSVGLSVKWLSGVRDVPLVGGNRATTSDLIAQGCRNAFEHEVPSYLGYRKQNLVDTFSSPQEVTAYRLIIELAPLEVRSFCHLLVRRRSEAIYDFRRVRSTMISAQTEEVDAIERPRDHTT